MPRDPARVPEDLVVGVREHTEGAADEEIRAALSTLAAAEADRLRRLLRAPPSGGFGPFAWADLARGIDPQIAAARELSGYYRLQAERDALVAMVKKQRPRAEPARGPQRGASGGEAGIPAPTAAEERTPAGGGGLRAGRTARIQHLLGLFAYHRDAPLVARSLRVPLESLDAELDSLGIRRKAYRLARGTDAQMPVASAASGPSGPPVRRRPRASGALPPAAPEPTAADAETAALRSALNETGARRAVLAERLGVSGRALLARFRAAGLERELALRERDLIRALWSKHRGVEAKVAAELQTTTEALRDIVVGRGLSRELEAVRDASRKEALRRRWPRERIEQVLHRREELRDLGLLEGLEREVSVRAGVIWKSLRGKRNALELLGKKLRLSREDALRLQKLLDLR